MDSKLKIASISLDITWAEPDSNIAKVEKIMAALPVETDIVVLPELFSTAFVQEREVIEEVAETNGGDTIHKLTELARRFNMAIAGTFVARTGIHYYNRAFFLEPSGDETFYDKRHMFGPGMESKTFVPGTEPMPRIRYRGWNVTMAVCYDLRFPAWMRNHHNDYDLLLIPANWPAARGYAWQHLLIARAIENQAVVVGANRSGEDQFGTYDGLTFIYDAYGQPIGQTIMDGKVVYATVDLKDVATARRRLPVAQDADEFTIKYE